MYIAEMRGRFRFQGQPQPTREEAAAQAFRNGPKEARECSTSGAYRDPSGNWHSNGMDIRWHKRHDFMHDKPQLPADHGLFGDSHLQLDLVEMLQDPTND